MKYEYTIGHIFDNDRWIGIEYEAAIYDVNGFVELVKKIRDDCKGKIIDVGEMRYKIVGAEIELIYQYDDLFGMIVEYPSDLSRESAIEFIKKYI